MSTAFRRRQQHRLTVSRFRFSQLWLCTVKQSCQRNRPVRNRNKRATDLAEEQQEEITAKQTCRENAANLPQLSCDLFQYCINIQYICVAAAVPHFVNHSGGSHGCSPVRYSVWRIVDATVIPLGFRRLRPSFAGSQPAERRLACRHADRTAARQSRQRRTAPAGTGSETPGSCRQEAGAAGALL